jgi:hypothetical protein
VIAKLGVRASVAKFKKRIIFFKETLQDNAAVSVKMAVYMDVLFVFLIFH